MRALKILVAIQAIALLVLFTLWSRRDGVTPTRIDRAGAEPAAVDIAAQQSSLAIDEALERRVAAPTSTTAAASPDAGRVVLLGRLIGLEEPPDPDEVRLYVRRNDQYRSGNLSPHGGYAVAGLTPGSWRIQCEVSGYCKLDFEHTIGPEPLQRLDLTLVKATVLTVRIRTPDDKRLAAQLSKLGIWQGLRVIATRAPLNGDFAPTENSSVGDVGIGRFQQPDDLNQRTEEDGIDGTLQLDQPPPANAALVLRHMVLAQRPIDPGQDELRFVVALADVEARFARLRVRVLGPDGPIEGARVSLSTAQGGGQGGKTDSNGSVLVERVLPGLASVEIWAKDAERFRSHLTIPSGGELDVGEILLTRPAKLKGRAVDANGEAATVSVQWTALDQWRPPHPLIDRRSARSDGDGSFELYGVGLRRYTVKARATDGQVGFAIVDAATPRGEPFVIAVRPAHKLHLDATGVGMRCAVVADRQGNPLDVQLLEPRWPKRSCLLPDGNYQLIVYDQHGTERAREQLVMAGSDAERVLR